MRCKYSRGVVIALGVFAVVLPVSFDVRPSLADGDSASEPSDMTIAQIVAAVVQTEHLFQTLRITDSDSITEGHAGKSKPWVKIAPATRPE